MNKESMARGGESAEKWYMAKLSEARLDMSKLMTENTKLRELVRIALEYCSHGYCVEEGECPIYESRHSCKLYSEASKLGIEVEP